MHLRDAVAADLPTIHAINQANLPAVGDITFAELEWFFAKAGALRVAELDGEVAGFLLALRPGLDYSSLNYAWFCTRYTDFWYIDRVAVDATWRRRGIARALYADAEGCARAVAAPLLACEVNLRPRNDESLAFHEHQGFVEVGQQDTDGGDKTVVMLVRSLIDGAAG
jgi:predicted GNAT superfamily acetyltransferase